MEQNTQHSAADIVQLILGRIEESITQEEKGKFTYIIGNNGSGKSRVLGALSIALENNKNPSLVACISSSIHDRFRYGEYGNVKYMGARNARNAVFLTARERDLSRYILRATLLRKSILKILRTSVGLDVTFSISEKSISYLQPDFSEELRDAIRIRSKAEELKLLGKRPLSTLNRIMQGNGRFEELTKAQASTLLSYLDTNIDIKLTIKNEQGLSTDFDGLSTGEQNRLLMFAKILSAMEEHSVFLIDEPELSLHLHWQMEFHKELSKILSKLNKFHVVIATHSPIMISEGVRNDGSPGNVVAVLDRMAGGVCDKDLTENKVQGKLFRIYSFAEVASHEQLVLRQFQTSPYQTREVSVEITEAILSYAEGSKEKNETMNILKELSVAMGLSEQAKIQIADAIDFVQKDLARSVKEELKK